MGAALPEPLTSTLGLRAQRDHSPLEWKSSVNQVPVPFTVELGLWGG